MHLLMQQLKAIQPQAVTQIPPSPVAKFLFSDTRIAWLWLLIRLYVGYTWFTSAWGKLTGHSISIGSFGQPIPDGAWVFNPHGSMAVRGFIMNMLARAHGPNASVPDWYAVFLQHIVLPNIDIFAYIITFGELCIGLGLLCGIFTGIAGFFGIVENLNYLSAGSVSLNPVLLVLTIFLVLAWRISGYYGGDRYLRYCPSWWWIIRQAPC